ncbi:MAG: tetratricopeptide repeat protein, partial [Clostridiales bacterium]|nr:tetratricopeptide repeat protein [Clostridiales bacterium]
RNSRIANAYYNLGLRKAKQRDLTGAVDALKTSLRFDKCQIDARNLLGLIYHEIGEVGAALAQWVISLSFLEQDNLAEEYIQRIYAAGGYLEMADQAAKKYNQALSYARNDNEDLAILMLMRMLEEFPQYVKAQELLALLYIHNENYTKAGRCLVQVLRIDHYNPTALRYMDVAKRHTGKADVEKKKIRNAFSHRQMQDDDIIMPPSYRENTGLQTVLNILAGLVLGCMVVYFLMVPAMRESLNTAHNREVQASLELLNQKNLEIDELDRQLTEAEDARQAAENSLQTLMGNNDSVILQYQNLIRILQACRDGDMRTAVTLYVDTDWNMLTDGVVNESVAWLQQDMAENGWQILVQMGDEAAAQDGGAAVAVDYYEKSLRIRFDNPEVLYKIGMMYEALGDSGTANDYFGQVILNYPDSEYAEMSRTQRGY